MGNVTVIGKNSFLARALARRKEAADWRFLDHETALSDTFWLEDTRILINCAFHPDMRKEPYSPIKDIDFLLGGYVARKPEIHYIMLSSRAAYGPAPENNLLHENLAPQPDTAYGQNKLAAENALLDLLPPERLTILRMANIFGDEFGRHTFFGLMLSALKNQGIMRFDIAPDSVRDFLPADIWAQYLVQIAAHPARGLYNIGAGFGITTKELSGWIIEGFGGGAVEYTDRSYKGQFILDMHRAWETFSLPSYSKAELKEKCLRIGQDLKAL